MKDREIIESYIQSLKDELMMYHDSLSEKSLPYIKCLKKQYNCWEKDLEKLDGTYQHKKSKDKEEYVVKGTLIDDYLINALDEFSAFMEYKNLYTQSGRADNIDMAHEELGHMMQNISDMFAELSECTQDNAEERSLVKTTIKSIYQMFG